MKEARLKAGLSQKQLGIDAGIDEFSASARVNQYETGKHHPDPQTVATLAKTLSVPMAFLFCDDDVLAKIIFKYSSLSEQEKEKTLQFFNLL